MSNLKVKTITMLLIAIFMTSTLVMATPVSAVSASPTIDGVIGAGEWDGALEIQVASSMGIVRILPTFDYLYVLFEVVDATDARIGENLVGNDKTSININPTDEGPWGKPYDIIFETGTDPNSWQMPTCGLTDGYETNWLVNGVQRPLPRNLRTKTIYNYTSSTRITEWKIPLATIDPTWRDTLKLGGNCDIDIGGSASSYRFPSTLQWADESTYVEYTYPKPPRDRDGIVLFDGVYMAEMWKTPHKLIVVEFPDEQESSYILMITIMTQTGETVYNRTFIISPRYDYLALYLHASVFPPDYVVVVSSSIGDLPYLVASRIGIERAG